MIRKTGWVLIATLAAVALLLPFFKTPVGHAQIFGGGDRPLLEDEPVAAGLDDVAIDSFAQKGGEIDVVIELHDEPSARVYGKALARARKANNLRKGGDVATVLPGAAAQANVEARGHLARIRNAQKELLASLDDPEVNAKILFKTQRVFNGLGAKVNARSLHRIKQLPEVKAIHLLIPNELDNSTSVSFIKAPSTWVAGSGRNAGEGIKIGIIDTGIDYIHTNFGGSGLASDYSRNNKTVRDDGLFPSAKVVGGYDFVGDAYTGSNAPAPDADPMDCNGHGTHVAGTAAGLGVNPNNTTYSGSYDASTPFSNLKIGPGVAPKADLYALRVFGCSGSTNVTPQAIEWAVDPNDDGDFSDHLDVINMSLGAAFGSAFDATAVASDNAVLAGVIVVASAGNSGDTHYITGSPGSSGRAISVAASQDDGFPAMIINSPASIAGLKPIGRTTSFGPALTDPGLTREVALADDGSTAPFPGSPAGTVGTTIDACSTITNAAAINGKIAVVERGGGCGFTVKVKNAQLAGAVGVIVVNNVPGPPAGMGGTDATVTIPSVMVSQSDGDAIKANLAGGVSATIALSLSTSVPEVGDLIGSFSSRGVRRGDNVLKPDVAAPGVGITSALVGSGAGTSSLNGTSMASPHVAGTMALLRQLHPDWSVEELKALVMNTAANDLFSGNGQAPPKYGLGRVGAGRVNLQNAVAPDAVALNADNPGLVSVSFGAVEVVGTQTLVKNIKIVNKGETTQTFDLSFVNMTDVPGVDYSLPDGSSITVGSGETVTFPVQLTANAAQMKHTKDATIASVQGNTGATNPRHYLSEESGYVVLAPASGGQALRVPVHAITRPASAMGTAETSLTLTSTPGSTSITLTGQDVNTGSAFPVDERSVVTALELQATSPNETTSNGLSNNADLKAVGVASDFKSASSIASTILSFGIATHGKWTTTTDNEFDIYFDTNRDGVDDFILFTTATVNGTAPNTNRNDIPVTQLVRINANGTTTAVGGLRFVNGVSANLHTVPFNTNVLVMTVRAGDLGLTSANSQFNYRIFSFSRGTGGSVDFIGGLTYNAARPGLDFSGGAAGVPLYFDLNGASIQVRYNLADYKAAKSRGALLLHHHNADGARDQILFVNPPAANAGADQTVEFQGVVTNVELNGSASTDPDDDATTLSYEWREGSTVLGTGAVLRVNLSLGSHEITLKVTDPSGGFTEDVVTINVVDTTPPAITDVAVDKPVLWPPDHQMIDVTVSYNIGDNSGQGISTLSVTSNEPIDGLGDGDTAPDWEIVDEHHVRLRAERSGQGTGRVYTITITNTDGSGNVSSQTVTVSVPKSQGKN